MKETVQVFLKGSKRSFRCTNRVSTEYKECGANVFTKEDGIYTCNACGAQYEGEK